MESEFNPSQLLKIYNDHRLKSEAQLRATCKEVWSRGECLDLDTLRQLSFNPKCLEWLSLDHPFYPTYAKMQEIETAFQMMGQARYSLIELHGKYYAELSYGEFGTNSLVAQRATNEVFSYVFAAFSLVEAHRRFRGLDLPNIAKYDESRLKHFTNVPLAKFIQELRNHYGHQQIIKVTPKGNITGGENRVTDSSLTFDKLILLSEGMTWNKEARKFISETENLNIVEIINNYHMMAQSFHLSYGSESGAIHTAGYQEIIRCKQAASSRGLLISLGMVFQITATKSVNPYPHLSRYFSQDEIDRIMCFPSRSKQQVDFLISLRDPLGLCDESTRNSLYEMFAAS